MSTIAKPAVSDNRDPRDPPIIARPFVPTPVNLVCMAHARAMAAIDRALARDAEIGGNLRRHEARQAIADLVAEHGAITVLDLLREVTTGEQP